MNLSQQDKDLILDLFIYSLTSNTENPTRTVRKLNSKYFFKFRILFGDNPNKYNKLFDLKKQFYHDAYHEVFTEGTKYILSVGHTASLLEPHLTKSVVPRSLITKAIESFWFSTDKPQAEEVIIESDSHRFAEALLSKLDIEPKRNQLSVIKQTIQMNQILS